MTQDCRRRSFLDTGYLPHASLLPLQGFPLDKLAITY
jgi:hypothetical protein